MTDELAHPLKLVFDRREFLKVDYLGTLDISIGIENQHPVATLVIESLALRFQSRRPVSGGDADPRTTVLYSGSPISISPTRLGYCTVTVRPSLLFAPNTNSFDVAIAYRLHTETIGELQSFIGQGWFLLIRPAPRLFGKVFVSYKEPEDRNLADLLFNFAKDAGFDPYMAPPDIKSGSRIWSKKIPTAIRGSKFVVVIWTDKTVGGTGVQKEIKLARKNCIDIVPLLEKKATDPKLFGRDVEYTRFDGDDPHLAFAEVIAARRR